ncbi:MAG: TRAP transporter large permease subunit [Desulfobacteraceae bacterium]|nr:MAG: TRAP transporter large permease subunit [Desulfobacteraceae bacterium]
MEWWAVLLFFIGGLVFLLLMGFPIAFSFLLMDVISIAVFMGYAGLKHLNLHIFTSLSTFVVTPVPLFILMGELMYHSRLAFETLDILDRWMGRLPGRLGLLAAVSGTIFSATSGSTMANTAMLGTVLLPEMRKRGYSKYMSVGPIIGVGGLAMLVPPSALAVVLASIGQISVSGILLAGTIPGIILGAMFGLYIVLHSWLDPRHAPRFVTEHTPLRRKLFLTVKYMLPMAFIIFMVLGLIILGIATPTEAAATGVLATLIVNFAYGRFTWPMLRDSLKGSLEVSVMVFMIIAASKTFSSILSFTGASSGLVDMVQGLQVHPIVILVTMQVIIALMGCFMETVSIMMVCLPVFMPICSALGFDPVWFGVLMLINLEMGQMTPPFGMLLFVMQGVAPSDVTYGDIVKATVPYMLFDVLIMAMIIAWPQLALWLPSVVQ